MEFYRGDIVYVENYHTEGSEQKSSRPAIIVSNDKGNKFSPVVEVVYLTSQDKKPLPTHVPIVCKVPSTALCEQVTTVCKERVRDFVRACNDKEMEAIDKALMVSLGITPVKEDTAEVDELKSVVAGKEHEIEKLRDALNEMTKVATTYHAAATKKEEEKPVDRIAIELGIYKGLYEQLLSKVMSA